MIVQLLIIIFFIKKKINDLKNFNIFIFFFIQIGVAFDLIILKNFQKKNSNEYSQPIYLQLNFRNKPTNLHSQFDFNPKNEALFYTQNLKESLTIKFGDRGIGYLVRDIENKKR